MPTIHILISHIFRMSLDSVKREMTLLHTSDFNIP